MYLVLIGFCFILNFLTKKPYKKICFQISFLILFVFSALRYQYGSDYNSYYTFFHHVKEGYGNLEIEEIGFYFINKIFPSFYLMVAVLSGIFLAFIYKLVISHLEVEEYKYALFIFLVDPYLFLMSLSMMRQAFAIVLFGMAIYFARQKKYVYYILICLLATTIHTSAIILIPFVFVANTNKGILTEPKWMIPIVIILFGFSATLLTPVIEWGLRQFNDSNYIYYYRTTATNTLRATILSIIPLIYLLLNISNLEDDRLVYSKMSIFSYITDILAYSFGMIGRFGYYFSFFKIIALPAIFMYKYRNSRGIDRIINVYIFPTIIVVIYLLRLYSFFTNPLWKSFIDYKTILDLL